MPETEKIKVIHQSPGKISCVMIVEKSMIDKMMETYGAHRLIDFGIGCACAFCFPNNILDSANFNSANVKYNNKLYYGDCYVVGLMFMPADTSRNREIVYTNLTTKQIQAARAWLLKHSV